MSSSIVLTDGQQKAADSFVQFLMSPTEQVWVLQGYSGTGKSTLVETLMNNLSGYLATIKLINPDMRKYEVQLTATTNKAAESFAHITGMDVSTIHSFLELRVNTDYSTGVTTLIPFAKEPKSGYLLFIDEASYIDSNLLNLIFEQTVNCKIVFIGDPAQLTPVRSSNTPVFDAGFTTAKLEEVTRQAAGNPIIELSTLFRKTVDSGEWFNFKPDGHRIIHLDRYDFENEILKEFVRPNWGYRDSKILGWTNKCVIGYNHAINNKLTGDPHFRVGDYAVNNKTVQGGKLNIKTDQLVYITAIGPDVEQWGVPGNYITLDSKGSYFFPKSLELKKARIKQAKDMNEYHTLREIDMSWIDLRAAFAQTINKSQGSTYDKVFIDLDDVGRCNDGNQIARMLYVAFSRARHQVFATGDFG